jgi:hypothetical protein
MREAVLRKMVFFTITHRGIVDHRVKTTELVDTCGDRLGPCDGVEVPLDHSLGSG